MDMGGKTPRDYQVSLVERCRKAVQRGSRSLIINAPTGAGKTFMACMLIKLAEEKGGKVWFMAPRRELIHQTSEHLTDCGVSHGVLLSGEIHVDLLPVQVASKDTFASRAIRGRKIAIPWCDLLVIDECRSVMGTEYRKIVKRMRDRNPKMVVIGLDATPARADGKGLGDIFDDILTSATYAELQEAGYLVPIRAYGWDPVDMNDFKGTDAQFEDEAAKRQDKPKLLGDIVEHWQRLASDRPTLAFTSRVRHSLHLRDAFVAAGVPADHLDGNTPPDERQAILRDLNNGNTAVVSNCDVLSEGYDNPAVSCIILASPTKSLVKFRQRSGRGLRPHPGKKDVLVLDHAGSIAMFGFPDEDINWKLSLTTNIQKEYEQERHKGLNKEPIQCNECGCLFTGTNICPECGTRTQRKALEMAIKKGYLKPLKKTRPKQATPTTFQGKQAVWHQCLAVMAAKGRSCSAAAAMYRTKAKEMPWETGVGPLPERWQWKRRVSDIFPQYRRRSHYVGFNS